MVHTAVLMDMYHIYTDTLNRDVLFYKLQKYNITGNIYIYKFIKSMYSNCVYAIKTNNTISTLYLIALIVL